MALMSDVALPVAHVRDQVTSAVDVVVQMARLRDGRRVVFEIAVVEGLRDGDPVVREVFGFRPRLGRAGSFVATGTVPAISLMLADRGESLSGALFESGVDRADGKPTNVDAREL
jgi:pilus assembly protein CpaF